MGSIHSSQKTVVEPKPEEVYKVEEQPVDVQPKENVSVTEVVVPATETQTTPEQPEQSQKETQCDESSKQSIQDTVVIDAADAQQTVAVDAVENIHPSNPTPASASSTTPIDLHSLAYDDLPDKRRVWPGAPGSREEGLGRLCLLTPDVVAAAAASSIRTGQRVALNWDLTKLDVANFNRAPTQHHITSLLGGAGFDDVYIFNPQQSSQWDGLRHFSSPYPGADQRLFYGGVTASDIADRANTRIGMQHWAQEGIVGRGVLLDYAAYAATHLPGLQYKALSDHAIPLHVLQDVARAQHVTFARGDILFVRIGLTREWDTQMSPADKLAYAQSPHPQHAGVEGTEEMLRWIWDTGFAAVAGDAVSFEVYPPKTSYAREGGQPDVPGLFMHEYLLPAWGVPVGELFDLEALSRMCAQHQRWTFFVTSSPLNMPGGVSSPPNCLAIF
ncbi:uncharacterized protein SPSK_01746 [Sporothrix schenckii 1099-18]|uniref:Cyclase n=1 Tax=Sporothrix schenckii 1099-18 TaxID=1397361 RepID=A0A0F2MC86_SPOSC|nr:uncharacterized protein SPSK_01746 [Sporothrix schenckii 1099-18]KJR87257.1 hypothetical protein SPSK_01746 [Sporothrix schenckii 1099-18]